MTVTAFWVNDAQQSLCHPASRFLEESKLQGPSLTVHRPLPLPYRSGSKTRTFFQQRVPHGMQDRQSLTGGGKEELGNLQ